MKRIIWNLQISSSLQRKVAITYEVFWLYNDFSGQKTLETYYGWWSFSTSQNGPSFTCKRLESLASNLPKYINYFLTSIWFCLAHFIIDTIFLVELTKFSWEILTRQIRILAHLLIYWWLTHIKTWILKTRMTLASVTYDKKTLTVKKLRSLIYLFIALF